MNEQEVKKLYQALLSKGYSTQDLGDEQRFMSKMQDATNRKQLYDWVSARGNFRIGDFDAYEARLAGGGNATVTAAEQPSRVSDAVGQGTVSVAAPQTGQARPAAFTLEQLDSMERVAQPTITSDTTQQLGAAYKHAEDVTPKRVAPDVDAEQERAKEREAELKEAYAERERLEKELEPYTMRQASRIIHSSTIPGGYAGGHGAGERADMKKHDALLAAKRRLDERIETLEESRDKNTSGFWRNLWRTVTNPSTWSFGLIPLNDALVANDVANKLENDTELNEQEETMLQQMVMNEEAKQKYGDDKGFMARAGTITGEALPFVAEFFLTGGGYRGVAQGVGSATTKGLAKMTATDLSKKGLRSWLVKSTGTVAGDVAGATLMANTTGAAKTASDAMERHRGMLVRDDETGGYRFGHYEEGEDGEVRFVDGGKSWAQSIYEAEAANTIEYYTEMLGTHMEKPLGAVGSWIAEKAGLGKAGAYMVKKLGLGEVSKDLSQITANGYGRAMKHVLERGGIQGYPSEVLEEEANIILNSMLVGDNSLSDLVDERTQADIWGGMLFSVGFMQSPAVGWRGIQSAGYLKTKHDMEKADKLAAYRMTEDRWKPLRERIDGTSNEDMTDLEMEIKHDDTMHDNEKKAALDYIGRLLKFRGWNIGATAKAKDEVENPSGEQQGTVSRDLNTSYIGGYEANEEQLNDIKNGYEFQRQKAVDTFGEINGLDQDPITTIQTMREGGFTPEQLQVAIDYVNAKAAYDGMIHRVRDDIDGRIAISDAMIESRQHHDDGMIHPATMKTDDRKVYVIGGKLVMNEDGTMIDYDQSDESIIIRDAATGAIEFADPHDVLSADEALDAAQEKEAAQEAIRQQYAQEAANKIDGVLPFNNGDTYQVVDEQGQPHTVTVVAAAEGPWVNGANGQNVTAGDGEVGVSIDGAEPVPMSREAIQQMFENANLARLQQYEQEQAAHREEQAAAEREANRPVYNINDEVTLQTEEGTVRGSITAEANEDGLIEVYTEQPIGGKKINLYNRDQLDGMVVEHNGAQQPVETPAQEPQVTVTQQTDGDTELPPLTDEVIDAMPGYSPAVTEAQQTDGEAAVTNVDEPMPMIGEGEDAEPDFSQVTPQRAHTYIYNEAGLSRDEANQFVEANKKAADKELEKVQGRKPKMGTSLAKYRKETAEWQQKVEAAQQVSDYWKEVKDEQSKVLASEAQAAFDEKSSTSAGRQQILEDRKGQQEKIDAAKQMYGDYFDDDMTVAHDVTELVALNMPRNLAWEDVRRGDHSVRGLKAELGLKRGWGKNGDTVPFNSYLARKGEGTGIDEAVHAIWESGMNSMSNGEKRFDDMEIKNALLELLSSAQTPADIRDYVINSRIAQAEATRAAEDAHYQEMEAIERENEEIRRLTGMEPEEYDAWISGIEERVAIQEGYESSDEYYKKIAEGHDRRNEENAHGSGATSTGQGQRTELEPSATEAGNQKGTGGNGLIDPRTMSDEEKQHRGEISTAEEIAAEEGKIDTNPTDAQKEAGNYRKGHVKIDGFDITIENPKGSVRSGVNGQTGQKWETTMHNTYGYIRGTEGVDGDHIDVFLSDNPEEGNVYVIDQLGADGSFDEHKVMYGFNSAEEARQAYLSNYEEGWQGLGAITEVSKDEFKKWVNSSHRKTKPFAEYKSVKPLGGQNVSHIEQGNERKSAIEPESYEVSDKEFDDILGELDDIFNGGASMMDFFDDNWGKGERQDIGVTMDGETTLDHVRELFDRFNTGEHSAELKALAHKVFALVKNLNLREITFSNDNEFNFGQQGLYASSVIRYRHNYFTHPDISNENKAHVLLHELIHACTMYAIRDYEKGGNHLSEDMKDAVKTLVDVYEQIKDDGSFKGEYGISDVKEMVAELSSPQFRAKMQAKKLWKKVVGAIKQLFGIKTEGSKETSAFSEASSALDYLLDNFDGEAYYLYSGRRATMGQKNTAVNESTGQSGADTRSGSVGRSASHSPAATLSVSFDAAKVRNFTQKAKRNIKNFLNGDNKISSEGHVNQVLGNLRRFFGMSYAGNSNYVVYDTPAGRLAFRLANHNARGDNFKRDNAEKNISVYVALEDYEQPGSSIPFTEYRISQEDFERHKDEFISSLVESVGNALNTGEFTQPSYTTKEEYGPEESTPFHEDDFFANYIELTPEQKAKVQTLGTRAAMAMIERGTTKFEDFAKAMVDRLGDNILPFLKSFYNGARDFPGFEDYELTPYEDVRRFDVLSLSRKSTEQATPTVFEKAEEVTKELEVERQAEEASERIREIAEKGSKSEQKRGKATPSKKKSVSLQQRDLFADVELNNNNNETRNREDSQREKGGRTGAYAQENGDIRRERTSQEEGNRSERRTDSSRSQGREDKRVSSGIPQGESERTGNDVGERLDSGVQERRNDGRGNSSVPSGAEQVRSSIGRSSGRISRLDPEKAERPANPKNTHNNHGERGKDYAPRGVDARIDANIKAIELMQQLIESGEQATPEQMAVLRQFSGWGGLGKAFSSDGLNGVNGRLRQLLGEEAYQQANMSRNSAYYTPANVIDALWDVARAMGFKGGMVLEGSAGIGNILGLMPTDMSERSDIHAVEIDQTTGNILSLLYPDAKVDVQGFEATQVENGSVDLAITNVPFVTGLRVNDTTGDKDLSKKFHDIHDFCIAKNVRKLREGGIGIFITSSGTLDNSARLREWIVQEGGADVVGAFRLNNETFGGTGATSDIIVIRKRVNGKKSPHAIDVLSTTGERTAEYDTGETKKVKGEEIPIIKQLSMDYNSYFVEHPEMMGGEMHFNFEMGETRYPTSRSLFPVKGKNQADMLKSWSQSFDGKDWGEVATVSQLTEQAIYEELGEGVKEGSMVVSNGQLCIAQRGKAVPLAVNANKVKGHSKVECFEAYQGIKKALSDLLQYQTDVEDDSGLQPLLKALNKAYDDFVKTYGHLHKNTSISFLKSDVDFANILALEKFSERGDVKTGKRIQEFGKTDIFSQRVVEKEKAPEPTNVQDGIIASIYVHGRVDVPWIVEQLNRHGGETAMHTEEEVKAEIVRSGLGFENPVTRQMEVSYEYLSGNVREKLAQAQANNADGQYDANIKALEAVVPMDIPAHLIDFSIGSSWIDPKLYEEYVKEKTDIDVTFTSAGGTWFMRTPYSVGEQKNRAMGVVSELLHKTIMGTQLIEAAMQNKTITVSETHKKWDGSTETITDKEATQACSNKIDEIRQDFKEWARAKMQSDPAMSERIERIYNDMFNNYVPRAIPDEFVPAHFGGAATTVDGKPFSLRPHQGKAVIRGTMQPLLLAHEVGTGKTYTLISTAMEMRRLGTARKPMIVVQNATVGQFVESAKKLYPNAKVLTLEDKDHTGEGRKNFYAKIKYNDWDMIVVPQSVFERIPDSEERQMRFVQDKIEEKMLVLEQMRDADPDSSSWIVKQAEKEINKLEDELAGLTDSISSKRKERDEKKEAVTRQNAEVKALEMLDRQTDDVENFDDMGIDAILVDEAHEYKHLGFATAMQRGVKGVDPSYSKKAQGVYLKTQAVLEKNNGRNVVFATGTPISNTAAEIWTFMRYLMPSDMMKEYGIYYFDDFVRNFGNLQQMLEFTTSAKFKEVNRFAGYVNLPELVRIWAGVADTVLTREAGGVSDKIPDMESGKAIDTYLPQTRALRSVMKYVKKQLDDFDKMSGKDKKANSHIPLTMYGIAKAAAVDARLVVSDAADEPQSKTNEAVRQTLRSLRETESYSGTVALFADNYQNKRSGFNLYEDIREKLIAQGVPAEQIVVMKSGMSVKKKLEIFDKVNRGEIRVIMGSTFTLGTGVNIQERLHTLIHLDAPNRPMDYTQRNGRILRQGNLHKEMAKPVRVLRFGVEDSLDVTAYQRLKTKGAIADSIMNGKQMMSNSMENRALEEEEDVFGDTVAQLSGSEYAMLKNQAEKDVRKYEAKKKQYQADQTYCHNEIPRLEGEIRAWKERLDKYRKNLAIVEAVPQHTEPSITVGKQTFPSIEAMADFIKEYNKSIKEAENDLRDNPSLHSQTRRLTVNVGGIDFVFTTEQNVETKEDQGTLFSAVRRKMTYSCEALGLTDVPVHQSLLREGLEDIVKNVISGQDFREGIERSERIIEKNEKSLAQVRERHGKPFEFEKELEQAHERFDEYSELMKKELEEKEKKYAEMDADVEEASDISEADEADDETEDEDSDVHFRDGEDDVESINEQFNRELQMQIDGTLPQGHIYDMGMPSDILLSTGIANVPIQLNSTRLESKSSQFGHDFALSEIKDLVKAINDPVAIFAYGDKEKAQNIIVEIQKEGNNFVVGLSIRPSVNGRVLEVNSIRNVFPKKNAEWLNWINQGKLLYVDKEKIQNLINQQRTILADVEYLDLDSAAKVVENFENPKLSEENLRFRIREDVPPRKTGIGYKVFVLKDGQLYPPMVANPDGAATPTGVWLDADAAPVAGMSKTGRAQVKAGGKGTQGGSGTLAYRPGWHLGTIPYALQFNRKNPETGERDLFPANFVWAEVEYANDVDYQQEAHDAGVNANGKYQHSLAGLKRVPVNGSYMYRTNPNPETDPWIITGAMKVKRILKPSEVDAMVKAAGREPQQRQDGYITDGEIEALNKEIDTHEREGEATKRLTYEESLAKSRRAGYTKKQHDAWQERAWRHMHEAAESTVDRLGLGGRVTILESADGLKGRKAKAKGWFDAKTGKIVVVLGNHHSVSDVVKTILHEGVAHYGLRRLFGMSFDQFLDNVYQYADVSVRREIVELAKKHGWDFREATEEYLARLAEDTDFERATNQGWWSKIKSLFLDMLHHIGLGDYGGAILTNNELRYILWRSYENMAEPGRYRNPFMEAEDISMQMRLGVGSFDRERARIHSLGRIDSSRAVTAEAATMSQRTGQGVLFRDGDFSERDRAIARDRYEKMVSEGLYQFQEAVQDSMLGLKKLYDAILSPKGKVHMEDVEGYENAYLAENRMSSVNAAEQHDYYLRFMQPLLKAIGSIAGNKKGARQALTDYMMAKHGLERNRVLAERDAREVEANGGDFNDAYQKFREKDYSGLTALTGEDDVAAAEAAAQQIVDDYEAAYDTADLWDRTREATQATLEKIYRSGLLSKERYEQIRDMFEYYIPLQGWDETTSDEVYGYLTSKSGPFGGSPIKHAVGRSSKADDPIATIAMMADAAIRQGNRNLMKQRFLNFVLNHPSDLVSVHDLWLEYDAATDEWIPVFADLEDGDTAADVERKVEAFEQRMEQLAEAEPDRYKRGREAQGIPYKVVKGNLKEHQVLVKRGGRTYVLTINGNPRAAQALNGLTNPDVEQGGVVGNMLKAGEWVNRHLSAFYTTRNPDFVVSNFFRDMLYSNCMAWVKESPRYALRYHKNFGRLNPAKMRVLLGKWEHGTLDMSNPTEHLFYQFMMNGGETGYTSVRDIEEHKREIAKELKKQGSMSRKAWSALGMQLDLLNRSVENCARFAAFVTSREMGRSIDRSIYDAKEVSVNFNKKGSGGKMVNATGQTLLGKVGSYVGGGGRLAYVFWNAGVQGLTNFGRAGKRHGGKAFAGAATMFILGYVIPQLAAAMGGGDGDDDDKNAYYNLPEYVRRSNICFRVGDQWVTIPLPIEFRSIYGLGELASGVISGNEHYDNKELSYQIASQVSQILPLDMLEGGGGVSPWVPSSAKPFVEAYVMNKGWTGLPIYKDTPWNQNDPEWTKAYKNADQSLVGASKWLNEKTGGDDFKKGAIDINPAKLEYLLSGVFGGYVNTAEKLKKMGETALGNREFDWRNMLLANRVVKTGDERTANRKLQNEYFKYKKEYEETSRLMRKYEDAADEGVAGMAEKVDFLYNSPEYLRYELFDEYKADIDDYREDLQETTDDAERKEIEAEMYATMRELIDQLHEIK